MKLIDLLRTTNTYHIKVRVVGKGECMYDSHDVKQFVGIDNYDVVLIDTDAEIDAVSTLTHSVSVRPILLVVLKED